MCRGQVKTNHLMEGELRDIHPNAFSFLVPIPPQHLFEAFIGSDVTLVVGSLLQQEEVSDLG